MLLNFDQDPFTLTGSVQHDQDWPPGDKTQLPSKTEDTIRNSHQMSEPPPPKRQKREDYRSAHRADETSTELPRKKFYRQRAHANPFSDHRLV